MSIRIANNIKKHGRYSVQSAKSAHFRNLKSCSTFSYGSNIFYLKCSKRRETFEKYCNVI